MTRKCKWVLKNLIDTKGALGRPITYDNHPTDRDKVRQRGSDTVALTSSPHNPVFFIVYRTQVYLGSDLWVRVSLTDSLYLFKT